MIKTYDTGAQMLEENRSFLKTDKYLTTFFFFDAPLLTAPDKNNYAILVTDSGKKLLAMKVEPYDLMLFGDKELNGELFSFLMENGCEFSSLLGEKSLCDNAAGLLALRFDIEYYEALAMDFMTADTVTEPSSNEVEIPNENDVGEIFECVENFIVDCGLNDTVTMEHVRKNIGAFRIIRRDGKIVAMAAKSMMTDSDGRITDVYVRPEYRGNGYARAVVNYVKNEIVKSGKTATLNVDRKNPVSNHIYSSLGFGRIFSQSEYRRVK